MDAFHREVERSVEEAAEWVWWGKVPPQKKPDRNVYSSTKRGLQARHCKKMSSSGKPIRRQPQINAHA